MGKSSGQPRIRVAAIVVRGNDILLAQHRKADESYWVLPGGGVDYGETIEEALVRELQEEANVTIRVDRLVIVNDSIPPDRHRHIVNLYFTATLIDGKVRVGTGDKRLVGMEFVPIARLPELVVYPDVRDVLIKGLKDDFAASPIYLGNLWKDA